MPGRLLTFALNRREVLENRAGSTTAFYCGHRAQCDARENRCGSRVVIAVVRRVPWSVRRWEAADPCLTCATLSRPSSTDFLGLYSRGSFERWNAIIRTMAQCG